MLVTFIRYSENYHQNHPNKVCNYNFGVTIFIYKSPTLFRSYNWTDEDLPLPEDADIEAAHPKITRKYEIYDEAYRMVSAKRSKDSLVNLVNWLLTRSTLTDNLAQASGDN